LGWGVGLGDKGGGERGEKKKLDSSEVSLGGAPPNF